MADLTDKQDAFCREYLADLNQTQAAIRAGYSPKTARTIGGENMQKPAIRDRILALMKKRAERAEVTADWVLARLVENVERSMQSEPVLDHEGEPTGEYRYHGTVANRALELLGKHMGMFAENLNLRTPDGPVEITVTRRVIDPSED